MLLKIVFGLSLVIIHQFCYCEDHIYGHKNAGNRNFIEFKGSACNFKLFQVTKRYSRKCYTTKVKKRVQFKPKTIL